MLFKEVEVEVEVDSNIEVQSQEEVSKYEMVDEKEKAAVDEEIAEKNYQVVVASFEYFNAVGGLRVYLFEKSWHQKIQNCC